MHTVEEQYFKQWLTNHGLPGILTIKDVEILNCLAAGQSLEVVAEVNTGNSQKVLNNRLYMLRQKIGRQDVRAWARQNGDALGSVYIHNMPGEDGGADCGNPACEVMQVI